MVDILDDEIPAYPMARGRCPFDPPPAATTLRDRAPVSRVRLWDGSTPWLVAGYADQRALLADPRISADPRKEGYPHTSAAFQARRHQSLTFISMDNPEHDRLRRMLTSSFMVKRVEQLRPRIQRIVDDLIDAMLAAGPPADLVEDFALPVPSLVICELLGVPYTDHGFFQRCSKTFISRESGVDEVLAAGDDLRAYLRNLVDRKIDEPQDDLLSRLGREQVSAGHLTRAELADMGLLLLVAGHETTANMIALGTVALLENPDQLAALRAEPDPALVASAVEELLRYLTIVHSGRRRVATADIEVGGRTIRAGEGVILTNETANRDPEVFAAPDTLDIHRVARSHVAFGYGVHQCLGQPLARVELQVVYSTLYRRIPALRLNCALDDLPFKHDMIIYGVHSLPVVW